MRTLLLSLFLFLLSGFVAQAQDLLTKRNGDELLVKVVEITSSEVKYRRADNLDGPLITVWKSDVFMIRYANGTKDVFGTNGGSSPRPAAVQPAATPTPIATPAAPAAPAVPQNPTAVTQPAAKPNPLDPTGDDATFPDGVQLSGPRLGVTYLTQGVADKIGEKVPGLSPVLSQFGWQFETRLFRMPNGVSGLLEVIPLVAGLEQGKFLPSISGILGMRGAKGLEFGVGPNLTPLGTSVVLAVGTSFRSNGINFPVNLAVVPGNGGARISLLVGFNAKTR
ncbi:hypothetical protein GCM10023185_40560 [Hymenobacter saemangeumensis]|uniref:Uncharacterized protein n=1 Tax=Hymenobacter saemangeumensis TaxID=1084522 RepID=A0ABP8IS08_9BACT